MGKYRRSDGRMVGSLYRLKFRYFKSCLYCGDTATQVDHVLPLAVAASLSDDVDFARPSVRRAFGQGFWLVPSCDECNRLASSTLFTSIRQKREHIRGKRQKKYRRLLRMPEWAPEELAGLGYNLLAMTGSREAARAFIARRLAWPFLRVAN